jgi:hypothetical protein
VTRRSALWLNNTQVTVAGLAQLKELTNLNWLGVHATGVTDAGLEHPKG